MIRVTIELWLWLGEELGTDFRSPSAMRSITEETVERGITIRGFLEDLAKRYPPIARAVFDLNSGSVYPHIVVNYNDRVISPHIVHDQLLREGDKITVVPMYVGG
jgi:sulfur carrier protein ThiS